jgi:MFS family permease
MVNPPQGWLPKGYTHPKSNDPNTSQEGSIAFESSEMLRTSQFYMVFLTFFLSSMAGMMVIGCIKLFGIDILSTKGIDPVAASYIAGTAMAWYAVFNGLGRILWGSFSDRIGRRFPLFLLCFFQSLIMFLFFKLSGTHAGLIVSACIIGFNYGGIYALFPAITADYFGDITVGKNYGWVFLASGLSGIAGPQIAGYFKDASLASGTEVHAWATSFMIASAGCLIAAIVVLFNKPPSRKNFLAF